MRTNTLIVTCPDDCHADAVIPHLRSMGIVPHVLISESMLDVRMTIRPAIFDGTLQFGDDILHIADIGSVWYRKPISVCVERFGKHLGADELQFVQAEAQETLDGLYALLNDRFWLTSPPSRRLAARKMLQLAIAREVGFALPRSIVTNDIEDARRFAESVNWDVALKSLSWASAAKADGDNVIQFGIFCRRLTQAEARDALRLVSNAPTMLQQYIPKRADLRLVAVGREYLFPVEIGSQAGGFAAEDCRFRIRDLPHRLVEMPNLNQRIWAYMDRLGLQFACFDFAIPESDDEPVFLEANQNGQWKWLEDLTGAPISRAIADVLAKHSRHH